MQEVIQSIFNFVANHSIIFGIISFLIFIWKLCTSKPLIPTIYSWVPKIIKEKLVFSKIFGRCVAGSVALFMLGLIIWKQNQLPAVKDMPSNNPAENANHGETLVSDTNFLKTATVPENLKFGRTYLLQVSPVFYATNQVFNPALMNIPKSVLFLSLPISLNVPEGNLFKSTFSAVVLYGEYLNGFECIGPTDMPENPDYHFIGSRTLLTPSGGIYIVEYAVNFYTSKPAKDTDFFVAIKN